MKKYTLLPAVIRYDRDLRANEKILYSELLMISYPNGYCELENAALAERFHVTTQSISGWISGLKRAGYIKVELYLAGDKRDKLHRKIFPLIYEHDLLKNTELMGEKADGQQ